MAEPLLARLRIPVVALVVTAAVYLPVAAFEFVCDDTQQIVWSQPYFTWRALPHYFTTDVWSHLTVFRTNYYRPVFMAWLMLNYKLFGLQTGLWHLSAIVAHLAATLLFYFLARRLLGDPLLAGGAALLFGVHPVHVEAVAWVSGATESIFAILAFSTILCHLRWREAPLSAVKSRWQAAALALFGTAMLAKESAIVLPVLLFAYEILFPPATADTTAKRFRSAFGMTVPYGAVVLLYLAMRLHALKTLAPLTRPWTPAMLLGTWPFVLAFYLRQLVVPFQYSMFYQILPVKQIGLMNFGVPLIVVVLAAAALYWIARRSRVAAFSALLLAIPILPVLNLRAFAFDDFVHDRYLYLPSAGLCILLAMGLNRIRATRVRLGALLALTGVLAGVTLHASRSWESNLALYTHAMDVAPESTMAQIYMGEELLRLNRFADALPVLKKALAGYPEGYDLYNDIAKCYAELGQYNEATGYFEDAIQLMPLFPQAYQNIATVEWRLGRLDQAEAHIRRGLELRQRSGPAWDRYHFLLGAILESKGDLKAALAEYRLELSENPNAEDVRGAVQNLSARLGE